MTYEAIMVLLSDICNPPHQLKGKHIIFVWRVIWKYYFYFLCCAGIGIDYILLISVECLQ